LRGAFAMPFDDTRRSRVRCYTSRVQHARKSGACSLPVSFDWFGRLFFFRCMLYAFIDVFIYALKLEPEHE
jgi:hypothetical protein